MTIDAIGSATPLCFCTIVSKNYIAQARALGESIRRHHPDSAFHVLLVDRPDGYFDPAAEPFSVHLIEQLAIPDMARFCFQYNVLELNTAAKPYFLDHLLKATGANKLVYLDPDILVLRRMDPLSRQLDQHNIVLTPHLTTPYPLDGKRLHERHILQSGTNNLGFLAIAAGGETRRMLRWWQERLYTGCVENKKKGLFVDQKWMELAPSYFDGVHVLRDPGYNVAYWNLSSRKVTISEGKAWADGQPLYFFHFSGFNPARPLTLSKHQNRLCLEELGEVALLYAHYAERLQRHGHETAVRWPYAFGAFDNGAPIHPFCRRLYLDLGDKVEGFGDPFQTARLSSFFCWLTTSHPGRIAPLLKQVRGGHPDLKRAYPQVDSKDQKAFLHWSRRSKSFLKTYFHLPEKLLEAALADRSTVRTSRFVKGVSEQVGVNLAGYIESEKGVGEASRAVVRSLEAAGIPYVLNNVRDSGSKNADGRFAQLADGNPYPVNIVQVNADQASGFFQGRPRYAAGKRNIGYWNWELSAFPDAWKSSFAHFDEIWAPSVFTRDAIAAASPIPVRCVPFSISVPPAPPPWADRGRFGLPEDAFLFLFTYDFHSYLERKNPIGLVRAFEMAFGDRPDVGLGLKTMHADDADADYRLLKEACGGRRNIHLLNEVYSRRDAQALMHLCDAYASLHRSEGYGLTIAEAMAMGKPVVATGYSANVDFMNEANSLPIRWKLVEIERDHGPYRKGMAWADPDLDHAALEMQRLVNDRELARRLGETARADIARRLSPSAVGAAILHALTEGQSRKAGAAA